MRRSIIDKVFDRVIKITLNYPPSKKKMEKIIKKSNDHWRKISENPGKKNNG